MRIAVVQLAVDPARRTVTFQHALLAIDEAAEQDPAPDLILLPAFGDVLAVMSGNEMIADRPAGPVVAACGLRARQWGVFVAMGFAERGPDRPYVAGVLIDRDGDLRLHQRQRRFEVIPAGQFSRGETISATDILLGRFAMLVGDDLLDGESWDAAVDAGAGLVLGCTCWGHGAGEPDIDTESIRQRVADHAARCGLAGALADVTTVDGSRKIRCPGASMIVDSSGEIVAAAKPGEPGIIWSDLQIPDIKPTEKHAG